MFRTVIDGLDDAPTGEFVWQYAKHTAHSAPIQSQYWIDPAGYVYPVDWHHVSAREMIVRYFGRDKLDSLQNEKINPVDFLEENRWLHVSYIGVFGDYTQRGYESLKTLHKRLSESNNVPFEVRDTLKHIAVYVS